MLIIKQNNETEELALKALHLTGCYSAQDINFTEIVSGEERGLSSRHFKNITFIVPGFGVVN